VEEKGILLIHLISFACGRERYPFDTPDLLHVWKRKISFLIHLISFTCGRERYPFDTHDLLHVWKRKVSF
jgi:NADH:ubiquinone oxidoreductase subunit H